jgi:hypothetical protein
MGRKLRIDMAGERFGRLIGVAFDHRAPSGHAHWLFRCDCGREIVASGGNVRSGSTSSCGCLHRELSAARLTDHGHRAAKRHDSTYRAWQQMRREPVPHCPAWEDYAAFIADLGERPMGMKLVRRTTTKAFQPDNCFWAPVAARSDRAARGWTTRRLGGGQADGARAASSQSSSSPAEASSICASTLR